METKETILPKSIEETIKEICLEMGIDTEGLFKPIDLNKKFRCDGSCGTNLREWLMGERCVACPHIAENIE